MVVTPFIGTISTQNLVPAGVATVLSAVQVNVDDYGSITIQTVGTYTGALSLQLSVDGVVWVTVGGTPFLNMNTGAYLVTITSALQSIFQANVGGAKFARVTALAAVTGSVIVTIMPSPNPSLVGFSSPLPAGVASLGSIASITASVVPGVAATNLGKAEDAVHTSSDTGIFALGVRYEALAAPASGANDYSLEQVDDLGKAVMMPFAPPINQIQNTTAAITTTADTSVFAAPGAGVRNYITSMQIINSGAVASVVELKDGTTVIARGFAPATGSMPPIVFQTPLKCTANTAFQVALLTGGGNVLISTQGFLGI